MKKGRSLLSLLLFAFAWEAISRIGIFPPRLFPAITEITLALIEMVRSGSLWLDMIASLYRAYIGLLIGGLLGIAFGVFTGLSKKANQIFSVLFSLFRQLPPVSLIPLMIVWFGIGDLSKIVSISFAVFFPVWINCHAGVSNIPTSFFWIAQTTNVGKVTTLRRIIVPASISYILVGLRGGIATAFIMVFVSELAGASSGLGYQIALSHLSYKIDQMIALMLILASCGAFSDYLLLQTINGLCPWLKNEVER